MNNQDELLLLVRKYFGWLEQKYGFSAFPLSASRIDLVSERVHLRLAFSVDYPRLTYLTSRSDGYYDEFDIWELLTVKRNERIKECFKQTPEIASIFERNELMLDVFSCALKKAGEDVLVGNDTWKKEYPGSPLRIKQ